jgi:hypothetical protein
MSVVLNDLQDMHRDAFADAPAPSLPINDSKEMTPKSYTASGAIAPGREAARSFTRIMQNLRIGTKLAMRGIPD